MLYLSRFGGVFIFLSFIFSIYSYFFDSKLKIISVVFIWFASLILFFTIKSKKLILTLLFFTIIAFLYSYFNNFYIDIEKSFSVNLYLLTLLISVGFLKLITAPKKDKEELPRGKISFIKTYLGIHLFGSIINLSALLLVADKMYKKAKLSPLQIIVLTRSFASDAYWSPFFVAFAAAITYAPKLETSTIVLNGIVLAVLTFLITYYDVIKNKEFNIKEFYGYPLSLDSLFLPILLALLVLITNHFYPEIKVIILISLFSILMTITILPMKKSILESLKILKFHITDELPNMKSEISLFLVAGMFGISISSILIGLNLSLPFEVFNWQIASVLLLLFILLAFIGIHPIITIAIIGDFLSGVNHTLLAMTFLMAWSTTVSTSPFSGLNLTIVSRYNCSAKEIFKLNIVYATKMYFICTFCLFLLSKYLHM